MVPRAPSLFRMPGERQTPSAPELARLVHTLRVPCRQMLRKRPVSDRFESDVSVPPGMCMEQSLMVSPAQRKRDVESISSFVAQSIDDARLVEGPFLHLEFDRVFPDDVYAQMLALMPQASDYRPMHGRSKRRNQDGIPTRVKIDLFPEYIRHLPPEKRAIWNAVGQALRSDKVLEALKRRMAPALEKRHGAGFDRVGMFPIPVLTRDIPGYSIPPHTDTHWKGITVQLYLPSDDSHTDIGTVFHSVLPDGKRERSTQMRFARNCGYAFAVDTDTWHSADKVPPDVKTRDSILLTYFVDHGPLRILRNRGKRIGNFVLNELRQYV
jgi:hypothetical protein